MKIYVDLRDWWVGVYIAPTYVYVCPLPCVVLRFRRRQKFEFVETGGKLTFRRRAA